MTTTTTHEAASLARQLMNEHGLGHWGFQFDKSTRRFGACFHGQRVIGLSEKLVRANTIERVRETILHEIAHALVGHGEGHGPVWKRQARALGISDARCFSGENTTLVGKYFGFCAHCGDKPVASRVQPPTEGFICPKHRTRLVWKDARGNVVELKPRERKTYVMTCSCCGVVGTTTRRPRGPQRHRHCGGAVTFRVAKLVGVR